MSKCALYLIQSHAPIWPPYAERDGYYVFKVGITNSPFGRLNALQTASPSRLELVSCRWLPSKVDALAVERDFHIGSSSSRLSGEWFYDDLIGALTSIDCGICTYGHETLGKNGRHLLDFLIGTGINKDSVCDVIRAQYGESALA